jgi:hypothetical protein
MESNEDSRVLLCEHEASRKRPSVAYVPVWGFKGIAVVQPVHIESWEDVIETEDETSYMRRDKSYWKVKKLGVQFPALRVIWEEIISMSVYSRLWFKREEFSMVRRSEFLQSEMWGCESKSWYIHYHCIWLVDLSLYSYVGNLIAFFTSSVCFAFEEDV